MNYKALKAEIINDPLNRGYSAMTDQQIIDSLTKTIDRVIVGPKVVGALGIMREIGPSKGASILDKLESAAASNSTLKWVMKELTMSGIDMGHPVTRAQIDALVTAGVLTASDGAALKSIAEKTVSRAEELQLGDISKQIINNARTESW
ncbi:MAG: hypothetical protein ACE5FD_03565 [Anaerolineae bacterium]